MGTFFETQSSIWRAKPQCVYQNPVRNMDKLHPSLTGDLSLVRYVWGVFHVLLDRTFVFRLCTKNPKINLRKRKNRKKTKTYKLF